MSGRRARAPVVRKADLARGVAVMTAAGFTPAMTFLPGGAVRLHPAAPNAADDGQEQREARQWAERLGLAG